MLIWYGLYDTNVLCFLKKPFNDWFSFLLLVLRYQESAIHRLGGFYYVHDPLNFYHRPFIRPWGVLLHHGNAERFARNGTLRERNETLRERNGMLCISENGTLCTLWPRFQFSQIFGFPRMANRPFVYRRYGKMRKKFISFNWNVLICNLRTRLLRMRENLSTPQLEFVLFRSNLFFHETLRLSLCVCAKF